APPTRRLRVRERTKTRLPAAESYRAEGCRCPRAGSSAPEWPKWLPGLPQSRGGSTRRVSLFQPYEFLELRFAQNRYAQLFGLVVLRSRITAHHHIVGFLADCPGVFPAMLLHQLSGVFARPVLEPARKHERLASKLVALHLALFRSWTNTGFFQLFDQLAVRRLREELRDAVRYFGSHFRHFFELFLAGRCQIIQRRKMLRQQLPGSLAYK